MAAHRLAVVLVVFAALSARAESRVKDLVEVRGVRQNPLVGYGLVVGLAGTGDTESSFFTAQSVAGMLSRLGIRVDAAQVRVRNVAAVMVTAELDAFVRAGTHLDVSVAAMGNARSLAGGVLLMTPLVGADGHVYAVAQGAVQTGAFQAEAAGSVQQKNLPTAGRVPGGGIVERAVQVDLSTGPLVLALKQPDFTTAVRLAERINAALPDVSARAVDPAVVEVEPGERDRIALLGAIEVLEVAAERRARIVISERTGTIVAGAEVRLRSVVVAHGGLRVQVRARPVISQPLPFSDTGATVRDDVADVGVDEGTGAPKVVPATATIDELAAALALLGASPRDLVSILQAMKAAGAFDADLEVL